MKDYKFIGNKIIRDDAYLKATGRMQYFGDKTVKGMLHGKIVWAEYAHANIKYLDTSKAEACKDVVTVLTYKDVPGLNGFGVGADDQQVFCEDKVRFIGDIVAVVVAKTEEAAKEAVPLIQVEYEPLEVLTTPGRAMEKDSVKIHKSGNILTILDYANTAPTGAPPFQWGHGASSSKRSRMRPPAPCKAPPRPKAAAAPG